MQALKMIIAGQILAVVTAFYPLRERLNEEEKQVFNDLKNCADILQRKKPEIVSKKLERDSGILGMSVDCYSCK